jgi:hypothetical protein
MAPKYIIFLMEHGSVADDWLHLRESVYGDSIKRISEVLSEEEIDVVKKVPLILRQASLDMMEPLLGIFLERLHHRGHGQRREHLPMEQPSCISIKVVFFNQLFAF